MGGASGGAAIAAERTREGLVKSRLATTFTVGSVLLSMGGITGVGLIAGQHQPELNVEEGDGMAALFWILLLSMCGLAILGLAGALKSEKMAEAVIDAETKANFDDLREKVHKVGTALRLAFIPVGFIGIMAYELQEPCDMAGHADPEDVLLAWSIFLAGLACIAYAQRPVLFNAYLPGISTRGEGKYEPIEESVADYLTAARVSAPA